MIRANADGEAGHSVTKLGTGATIFNHASSGGRLLLTVFFLIHKIGLRCL